MKLFSLYKVGCWGDRDLSNDDIIEAFTKGALVSSSFISGRSVVRINSDTVVKHGRIYPSEILAMELVRKYTIIPIPQVYRYFSDPTNPEHSCLVLQRIEGRPLDKCWDQLSIWRQLCIIWSLRNYVQQFRCIPNPHPTTVGPAGPTPRKCWGIMFGEFVSVY